MASQSRSIPRNVERALWAESGGRCANPSCATRVLVSGNTWIGEIAHIVPFAGGGPTTADNLLVLCPTCHTTVDKDRNSRTIETLRTWKRQRRANLEGLSNRRFRSFDELADTAKPLLNRNRQIWEHYGPRLADGDTEERRNLWARFEPEILANNRLLVAFFASNEKLFPRDNWALIQEFEAHAIEFEGTRGQKSQVRRLLFPDQINAVFGLYTVDDTPPEHGLSALQNFIAKLIRDDRFIDLALLPNEAAIGRIAYLDGNGQPTTLLLNNTPRLRQEYWSTYAFNPKSERTRFRDLLFILGYLESRGVNWSHRDPTQLHEVTIRGGQRIYLLYKYIVTRDDVQSLNAPAGSAIVNQHGWNQGPFTDDACSLAVDNGLVVLNQENFFGWLHTGMLPTERRLRDAMALVPLSAITRLFLFGSALLCDRPGDIDLVAIYTDGASQAALEDDRTRIGEALRKDQWRYTPLDFTSLSERELSQTRFLDGAPYREIPL